MVPIIAKARKKEKSHGTYHAGRLTGSTDYAALRPDRWAAAHPEHIRTYRADERRDRAAAQHHRRARRRAAKRAPS